MGAKFTRGGFVMVNFMCQLNWVTEHPDIWSKCYSGSFHVGVFG